MYLKIVYDDLLYLIDVHDKIEGLTDDEKMDVEDKLVGVFIYRISIEKKSICAISSVEEDDNQIEFFVELNESLTDYIINQYLDSNGNIKWFNFYLFSSFEKEDIVFTSSHYGEEIYILRLNAEEVEKAISTVENNDAYVRINRHQHEL